MSKFTNSTTGKSLLDFSTKTSLKRALDDHKLGLNWVKHVVFAPAVEYSHPIEDIYPEVNVPLYTRSASFVSEPALESVTEDVEPEEPEPEPESDVLLPALERADSGQPVIENIYPEDDTLLSAYDRNEIFEGYTETLAAPLTVESVAEMPAKLTRGDSIFSILKSAQRQALRDKILRDRILGTATTL